MRAVATISQSALAHNLSIVRRQAPQAKIMAMVKANAYGHHLNLITPLIENADILAVSELSEARQLRQLTHLPILLLSGIYTTQELQEAIDLNCQIVVHHSSQVHLISNSTQALGVWLKIDTGMHRLGLSNEKYQQCLSDFKANTLVNIECVMSHFACADDTSHPMNQQQLSEFKTLTNSKNNRSMANSAAILSLPASLFEFVRPGIMLYGASPFADDNADLKPVMQLSAPVLHLKTIQAGETVGYGANWTAENKTTLAIIGIGYGDGYPRHAKNGTPVLVNNTLCTLAGRVSMDMIAVDIADTKVLIGDSAILWGDEKLRVETVAEYSNTISYELLTGVSSRVKFVHGK
ncbi:Alanine racemase [Bathymodiolus heckerae thiotrophic gill symbiont]|uniref:alanine racemase n=1 Tax=Bathymodiolus heckerae thiotrophic gill symbiont TaxID=1052212 RepID=UPI0010B0E9BB|nr:alanine racemase [Bathymodiolus heckerae thiotrophic gill symbiont]CAC9458538.1 Alanine racemase (EC 5.1.1.1) [uncultured Gammaproteobacteria bacterium]SMN13919.1 Alanine racemase [Bathymodiolus heckerae thiotrophic gill symbiont]